MQAVALTQDTAIRVPLTLGIGMTVHDVPSRATASGLGCGLRRMPTATHDDRDVQDTADSPPFPTAAVTWVVHVLPFQRSMPVGPIRPPRRIGDGGARRSRSGRRPQ